MSRPMRGLVLTIATMVIVGLALSVGVLTLLWYQPVPRTWWSLAILMVSFLIPGATAVVGVARVRRLKREIEAERMSRRFADQQT